MAKNDNARNPTSKRDSSATGGPATGRGINYQINYAMLKALDLIAYVLTAAPLDKASITLEPRKTESGGVTRWDIHVSKPDTVIEAKVTPTRNDILEWVDRVRFGATQSTERQFHLLYARGAPPLLASIERLCRIAREAMNEEDLFLGLFELEHIPDKKEMLKRFGPNPERTLSRIRLVPVDETSLENDIQLRLRFLTEPAGAPILNAFLFKKFSVGLSNRTTFHIADLIAEAERSGITFRRPPQIEPYQLDPAVHACLFILQSCPGGLPPQLLADACGIPFRDVEIALLPYFQSSDLTAENGVWIFNPLNSRLAHKDRDELLPKTLKLVLNFIRANRNIDIGRRQVGNAISLAKACETQKPDEVARIFITLDKLLKRTGNKRLVLEVANMAVRASVRSSRTPLEVQGEAQARICGISWVFQRVGRLEEAATEAEKSLKQGEAIHWDRNTAFCYKCIGRLCRMQAEQAKENGNEAVFQEKIRKSIDWLNKAIEKFTAMTLDGPDKFGPDSTEVGDCYSLLGRTYFVTGQFGKADQMAHEARRRLKDEDSKDYMDLRILFGDLASERRDPDQAINHYSEALSVVGQDDAERSEIAARALFRRGICRRKFKLVGAKTDLKKSIEVWRTLDEQLAAAEAEWHLMLHEENVPLRCRALLEKLSAPVRVETIRLYQEKLSSLPKGARAQRKELPDGYVKELIRQAEENWALMHREW